MVASRKRPKGSRPGPFGLSVLAMILVPTQIGYQDLVALMARQPEASERARARMLASPFGTIHAATFSFPRPIGTQIPEPPSFKFAGLDPRDPEFTGTAANGLSGAPLTRPRLDFPQINRRLKGDLLVTRPREEPPPAGTRDLTPGRVKTVSFPRPAEASPAPEQAAPPADTPAAPQPFSQAPAAPAAPKSEAEIAAAATQPPPEAEVTAELPPQESDAAAAPGTFQLASLPPKPVILLPRSSPLLDTFDDSNAVTRLGQLYFGGSPVGDGAGTIQPWPMDEELLIQAPAADPDFKRAALAPSADKPDDKAQPPSSGQTVAPKGEVTGVGKRPRTPAERLKLDNKSRAKSEKCLAEAVYFESRGEPKRGQIAVAQVVMNRVFSGFYPTNVCGVVYQNAHRKLACQFTFACDNVPDVVNEPKLWDQAKEIARDMLDGKLWLPEIGHSTHYHAYWVHPSWANEMRRLHKIGVHSFYRPRNWGDGSDMPPLSESQSRSQTDDAGKPKAKL